MTSSKREWIITKENLEEFCKYHKNNYCNAAADVIWKSPEFRDDKNFGEWRLELKGEASINQGHPIMSSDFLKFRLRLVHSEVLKNILTSCKVNLCTMKDGKTIGNITEVTSNHQFNIRTNRDHESDLISGIIFQLFTAVISLRISCQLTVDVEEEESLDSITPCFLHKLQQNIEKLFTSSEFSDFEIKVSNKNFKVHKNILSASSPVFHAMLTNDMKEKNCGYAEINNFREEVVQELLRFIYCGKVKKLESIAQELSNAAEEYMLDDLKIRCLAERYKNLKVDHAISLLVSADDFRAEKMKLKILSFIRTNIEDVMNTRDFKSLDRLDLLKDIMSTAMKK